MMLGVIRNTWRGGRGGIGLIAGGEVLGAMVVMAFLFTIF